MREMTVRNPLVYSTLAIYLVEHPKEEGALPAYSPLIDAHVSRGVVVISESDDLEQIQIENASGGDLFVQAGQVLRGGCYNRIVTADVILPAPNVLPASEPLPVLSVEESDGEQRPRLTTFSHSPWLAPTLALKLAVQSGNQQCVWDAVARAEHSLCEMMGYEQNSRSHQPLWRMLNTPEVHERYKSPYTQYRILAPAQSQAMGAVMVFNGRIAYADLYCSPALFQQMWQQLLFTAAVEEMLASAAKTDPACTVGHPTKEGVTEWLARTSRDDGGEWVHRSILASD